MPDTNTAWIDTHTEDAENSASWAELVASNNPEVAPLARAARAAAERARGARTRQEAEEAAEEAAQRAAEAAWATPDD